MNKVMFILHTYSVGGAERRCIEIANYLASKGNAVKVVLLDIDKMYSCRKGNDGLEIDIKLVDSPKTNIPVVKGVELVYLLHSNEVFTSSQNITCIPYCGSNSDISLEFSEKTSFEQRESICKQFEALKELYVDRIFNYVKDYPDYKVVSWMTFCNLSTAAALQKLPNQFAFVECTAPTSEFDESSAYSHLKKMLYPRAEAGFFQTEEIKNYYSFLDNAVKYVIPNPIRQTLPERYCGERKKYIVNFCRVEKPKNLSLLIEAFELFRNEFPDYHLHIYGDGSERKSLESKVEQMHLKGTVSFFDFTTDVHRRVIDYKMFVSSSDREGLSNSMLEAMAIGLPTVCTDCQGGGAREVIINEKNGLLVPTNDKNSLAKAMMRIASSEKLCDSLSKEATKVKKEYSIEKIGLMWHNAMDHKWSV